MTRRPTRRWRLTKTMRNPVRAHRRTKNRGHRRQRQAAA